MTRILVDADMLLFRACSAAEVEVELADDVWVRHSEQPVARQMYWDQIYEWCDQFKAAPEHVMHCFTERSAFRRELSPSYKANRKGSKPTGFKAMKSEILQDEGAFMFHKIEADDLISIFAGMLDAYDDGVVIASGDKDLKQVPGTHVWINTEPYEVSPDEATRFTYQQCLSGDSTDGIPGCKGVGPVNAERIVSKFDLFRVGNVRIEVKGWWPPAERSKFLAVVMANPELRIFVALQRPHLTLNKKSNTTYAMWCQKYGIAWCPIPIPPDFLRQWLAGQRPTFHAPAPTAKARTARANAKTAVSTASSAKDGSIQTEILGDPP